MNASKKFYDLAAMALNTYIELFNVTREVLDPGSPIVLPLAGFSLSGLKQRIAPRLCTQPTLNLQQKAEETRM